jgi:pimeloyl-ACP methyl ester carboxylesterase
MIKANPNSHVFALVLVSILIASCGSTVVTEPPVTEEKSATTVPPEEGTWETFEFASQALADNLIGDPATRTIHVYLPPGYNASNKRYPVVYALHGIFTNQKDDILGMGKQLNSLISEGEAREMVLVFPDGDNLFGGSHYLSSPTIGDYESYISKELVAHVDSNYRTIPNRDARGITGCSMGGNGALHLAFKFPEIFSSAAGVSGYYAYEKHPFWERMKSIYNEDMHPYSLDMIVALDWQWVHNFGFAAATAPNPDNIPFYFDLPFEIVDGEVIIVPEVLQKVIDSNVINDVHRYLDQPVRLRGVAIYHGVDDYVTPLDLSTSFSETLTDLNVEHDYIEVDDGHCDILWDYTDVLEFMSANLASE